MTDNVTTVAGINKLPNSGIFLSTLHGVTKNIQVYTMRTDEADETDQFDLLQAISIRSDNYLTLDLATYGEIFELIASFLPHVPQHIGIEVTTDHPHTASYHSTLVRINNPETSLSFNALEHSSIYIGFFDIGCSNCQTSVCWPFVLSGTPLGQDTFSYCLELAKMLAPFFEVAPTAIRAFLSDSNLSLTPITYFAAE